MKFHYLIFFLAFFTPNLFGQTKIVINQSKSSNDRDNPYCLKNEGDSIYVSFSHSEDMGAKYGFRFELKSNVPDGIYQIYLYDAIYSIQCLKNGKRDEYYKTYYSDGTLMSFENYKEGKRNGSSETYYNNGKRKSFAEFEDDYSTLRTEYYENGSVKSRQFCVPENSRCRYESYDLNGRISSIIDDNVDNYILTNENHYKDGILDGFQRYVYKDYFFRLEYQMNTLVHLVLRDKKGNIIKDTNYR